MYLSNGQYLLSDYILNNSTRKKPWIWPKQYIYNPPPQDELPPVAPRRNWTKDGFMVIKPLDERKWILERCINNLQSEKSDK